jgi:hypothetical protein
MSSCEAEGVKGTIAFPRAYNELMVLVVLLVVECRTHRRGAGAQRENLLGKQKRKNPDSRQKLAARLFAGITRFKPPASP